MITLTQYFAGKPHTKVQEAAAEELLIRVNALVEEYEGVVGAKRPRCPNTGSEISGSKNGSGDGGFRLDTATTGRDRSAHKVLYSQAENGQWFRDELNPKAAVDCYDPGDPLDKWLDTFEDGNGGNTKLAQYELYREAPSATPGWCHLTDRPPHSGHRTYIP